MKIKHSLVSHTPKIGSIYILSKLPVMSIFAVFPGGTQWVKLPDNKKTVISNMKHPLNKWGGIPISHWAEYHVEYLGRYDENNP